MMDNKKKDALLVETKMLLKGIIGSAKEVQASKLSEEYMGFIGYPIPFKQLDFPDLQSFIQSIPDTIRIERNRDGEVVYKEVVDEKTKHLAHFTKATKKKKSTRAKPHPAHMRRPTTPRPAFSRGRGRGGTSFRGRGGYGGYTPAQTAFSRNTQQNTRPNQYVRPNLHNNYAARARLNSNFPATNQAPKYQQSWPGPSRSTTRQKPRFSPPRPKSPLLPTPPSKVAEQPRPPTPEAPPPRQNVTPPARTPRGTARGAARRGRGVNRCFNRAISQLKDQESKGRLQVQIGNPNATREEVKAAAAVAVSSMKDVPPRFSRISGGGPTSGRQVTAAVAPPDHAEEEWEDEVVEEFVLVDEIEEGEITDDDKDETAQAEQPADPGVAKVTLESDDVILPAETIEIQALKTDYKILLLQHCQRMHTRPHYETLAVGSHSCNGFACNLKALNETYGSYGVFRSAKEAEMAAARNACERLGLLKGNKSEKTQRSRRRTASDFDEVKRKVQQILEKKKNGLFMSRLAVEYKEQFREEPPANLLDKLEEWTDIVSIESFDDSNRKILYPRLQSNIKLTEQETLTLCKIPNAESFTPGTCVNVVMSQIYDCSHFYVQRRDSGLLQLMEKLQEIYEARGSPKALIQADPGTYCVARFLSDEQWYRAQILNVSKKGDEVMYDVLYVDFGNCETVSAQCVRRILDNLCTLPAQAVRCCLANCYPPQGDNWDIDSEAVDEMMKLTMSDDSQDIVMHVDTVDSDKGCSVRLFHSSDLERDLSQWLISRDLASAQPVSEEPPPLELPEDGEWDVYVCYINNTTDIVVRLVGPDTSEKLSALEDNLATIAVSSMKLTFGADGPQKGALCMVKQEEDGEVCYIRARVMEREDDKVLVEFLDHGDKEVVELNCVKILPAKYNQLPYQAIPAKLTGLEAFENHDSVRDKLMELAFGKTCVAEVDDRMDKVSLTLWDTSTEADMNINETVAKVLNIEDLAPKMPGKGGTLEGYVSHVTEEGQLYFQVQGPGLQSLESMADEMTRIYEKESTAQMFVSKPTVDKVYACKGSSWHRVKICSNLPGRRVDVFFVDYGYQDVVHVSSLRNISPQNKHIHRLPHQAVECSLFDLPPEGYEWSTRALERVTEVAPDNELRVLEVVYPGDIPQVEVYFEDDNNEMISVSEILKSELHLFGNEEDEFGADHQGADDQQSTDVAQPKQVPDAEAPSLTSESAVENNTAIVITEAPETKVDLDLVGQNITNGHICNELSEPGKLDIPRDEKRTSDDSSGNLESDSEYLTPRSSPERNQSENDPAAMEKTEEDHAPVNFESDFKRIVSLEGKAESCNNISIDGEVVSQETNNNTGGDQHDRAESKDSPSENVNHSGDGAATFEPAGTLTSGSKGSEHQLPMPPVLELPKTSSEDVFITYVSDPWNFWVIKNTSQSQLLTMMEEMQAYYTQDIPRLGADKVVPGQVYASLHDGTWYRAIVKQVSGNDQVMVHFVDYGDFSLISIDGLRCLPMDFRLLPFQAFQCKLEGIRPPDDDESWSLVAGQRLSELLEEKTMTAWILGNTSAPGETSNKILSVTLVDMENTTNAFMHKILLEEGLAVK